MMRIKGQPSRAQFKFSESQLGNIQRSVFDRSHGVKTTFSEGYLVPIFVDEVLPGDTFNLRMTALCRGATFLYPIMDNIYLESFWFFVPSRLVWDNWEKFNGAQDTTSGSTNYVLPTITAPVGGIASGDLGDYFGLPTAIANYPVVQSLPFRAYNLIWNEWFRDENLQNKVVVDVDDGPDTYTDYVVLRRGKRKDYFTSALPWTQKVNDGTVVGVGLSGTANVLLSSTTGVNQLVRKTSDHALASSTNFLSPTATTGVLQTQGYANSVIDPNGTLYTDLSSATVITINALRQAFQLQRLYERDARGGTRYVEILWSHFGVRSPDYRLQRPELLGTGYSPINVHPVAQTAPDVTGSAPDTGLGDLAAFSTGSIRGHGFSKSFVEHGYVIGLISTRADLNYWQGVERMWSRSTRYDFYWPTLGHIGEQAILNKEIYLSTDNTQNNAAFGYTGRYNEYRYKPGKITGLFRTSAAGTLDSWHLAQEFSSLPTLGNTFVVENAPMTRIKRTSGDPDFILDAHFSYRCARPMSVDAIPGFVDHF